MKEKEKKNWTIKKSGFMKINFLLNYLFTRKNLPTVMRNELEKIFY